MNESDVSRCPTSKGGRVAECPWCKLAFALGASTACLSTGCSGVSCASTQSLPRVASSPSGSDSKSEPAPRQLHVVAARILMNIMYGARFARPDLLRAVSVLARRIAKWDEDCDKRLLRLIAYIHDTLHFR